MAKNWIGFDLDGTLAEYSSWQGVTHIGRPIPKMVSEVRRYLEAGWTVKIFTARTSSLNTPEDQALARSTIEEWCLNHIGQKLEVTSEKDFNLVEYYDDRAISVEFNTGIILMQTIA